MLRPATRGRFTIFLKQGESLVLYTSQGETFTQSHRQRLLDTGVEYVYVRTQERGDYEGYIRRYLAEILHDANVPIVERAHAWGEVSASLMRGLWEKKLPRPMTDKSLQRLQSVLEHSIVFLQNPVSLKSVVHLLGRGFKIYHHSLGTLVFTMNVVAGLPGLSEKDLVRVGLGALMHDIGKARLPDELLSKRREHFSASDWRLYRSHPALGVGLCAGLQLSQETINCMLLHHEREDERGFPSGLGGEDLPSYVKALILCNAYDNLTRATPDGPALSPFESLKHLQAQSGAFDKIFLRRLIRVLSSAELA